MRKFREELPDLRRQYEKIAQTENIDPPLIKTVLSVPCFEYWLLLHYQFTDMPFKAAQKGGKSACDQVIELLRHHIPDYKKNDHKIFERCQDGIDTAVSSARKTKGLSPSCADMGDLVTRLRNSNDLVA